MQLSTEDKRRLVEDGYVVIPGAASRERVDAALRVINRSLGEEGLAKKELPGLRAKSFCPELVKTPEIVDLYRETGLRGIADSAIGEVKVPKQGQIALRFPQRDGGKAWPHVDGMYAPDNGVKAGTIYHFTALGAVFLSDVTTPEAGNFTVWPGTHRTLEAYFRAHGPESLLGGFPPIALPEPRPVLGRAGDVLLAHYALAHGIGPNTSPHVRYAVFFRLFHADHDRVGTRSMTELWLEWEGLRGIG